MSDLQESEWPDAEAIELWAKLIVVTELDRRRRAARPAIIRFTPSEVQTHIDTSWEAQKLEASCQLKRLGQLSWETHAHASAISSLAGSLTHGLFPQERP